MCKTKIASLLALMLLLSFQSAAHPQSPKSPTAHLHVPPGFIVDLVAAPPLVEHPMMGGFDELGRLFLAESAGQNLKKDDLLKQFPNFIRVLEAGDAQGRFTKGHVWADKLTFPMGALWHQGALYTGSSQSMWRLRDTTGKGVADQRKEIVTKFGFTGNAADIHGPFLGPDGRLYWCDGRHGHEIARPDGTVMKGKAARIFRSKPDGTEVEVVCGGGMDNPVEIAFTDEGEPFATVNILHAQPARNDGIIYCIEGGVYPYHEVYKEFPRTGDLLPSAGDLGWVAPSGLMRYRSGLFGKEYQGNLLSAQFNRGRIQRHIVERAGAGFALKTEDFLTSTDKNFHPTDVLEDADGSLLVIDTGGWFRIGCPTSQIARPEIKGAIYRVRKEKTPKIEDPRGLKIAWAKLTAAEMTPYLDDPRFVVRDRAMEELAARKEDAFKTMSELFNGVGEGSSGRRNAVWALTRIDHPQARAIVRTVLGSREWTVRMAAIHSAGLHKDSAALPELAKALSHDDAALRRQAATALGRIGKAEALPSLFDAMRRDNDRFLEHALIYALLQIGDQNELAKALDDRDPRVCRAAVIALDQMQKGSLSREKIKPLLAKDHSALTQTLLEIIAARPGWGNEAVSLLRRWLANKDLDAQRKDTVRLLVTGLAGDTAIQDTVIMALRSKETAAPIRLALLESLAAAPHSLPGAWLKEVGRALEHRDPAIAQQAIAIVHTHQVKDFDITLEKLADDGKRDTETRLKAFAAVAPRMSRVNDSIYEFVVAQLQPEQPPLRRLSAASALGQATPSEKQQHELAKALTKVGPLELPALLPAFEKTKEASVGRVLLAALEKAPALTSLSPTTLDRTFRGFPDDVRVQANALMARLAPDAAKSQARLEELEPSLNGGDVQQGRIVFFGPKAACASCHALDGKGGKVGPDLGKIAAIRSGRDLLESVVFPSASFARGYEPYVAETKAGKVITGILTRETTDAVTLVNAERQETRIARSDLESILPGRVSIMPQGLDVQLTRPELRDLMAFLQSLK